MKKKLIIIAAVIFALFLVYFIGTGFIKNPSVGISDFSVTEDGKDMIVRVDSMSSAGYVRSVSVSHRGNILCLDFKYAFGGINGSIGARDSFCLSLDDEVGVIAVYRGSIGYEPVLVRADDGVWQRMPSPEPEPVQIPRNTVTVSTVDEFLWAIGSNTVINLAPGTYDLSTASDYGQTVKGASYRWEPCCEGWQLVITGIHDLSITGSGNGETEIVTPCPYAYVLYIENASDIYLSNFAAGHSASPDSCSADVLYVAGAENVEIFCCDLYGCGVRAINVSDCSGFTVNHCALRDCSGGAMAAYGNSDVRVVGCDIMNCGKGDLMLPLFDMMNCDGAALVNCNIIGNRASHLVFGLGSREVYVLGCDIGENRIITGMFATGTVSTVVDGCCFRDNLSHAWYDLYYSDAELVNAEGKTLTGSDLYAMELVHAEYSGPVPAPEAPQAPPSEAAEYSEQTVVSVSDVDGFLAAIASNTRIELAPGFYDLSAAKTYGLGTGGAGYRWDEVYDGWELVLSGVVNLDIIGTDPDNTVISAVPRYANVLSFLDCGNVFISGIHFGHTKEPGECRGGVLLMKDCYDMVVDNSSLYGCGILGIEAYYCKNICVTSSEIYECSYGAVELSDCVDVSFINTDIHDCGGSDFSTYNCINVTYDGVQLDNGSSSFYGAVG